MRILLVTRQLGQDLLKRPRNAIHRLMHRGYFFSISLGPSVVCDYLQGVPDVVIHLRYYTQAIVHNLHSMLVVGAQNKNKQGCYKPDKKI